MSVPRTVRLEEDVEKRVEIFLKKNAIRFPQLVNMALEKYISEPQTITFEPVDSSEFMTAAKKAYKKHRSAVDKLK